MGIGMVLDMVAGTFPDRLGLGSDEDGLTYGQLRSCAATGASLIREEGAAHLVFIGVNGPALPVLLFAAGGAGVPFAPLNYRLPAAQLRALIGRLSDPLVVCDESHLDVVRDLDAPVRSTREFMALVRERHDGDLVDAPDDGVAVVLFTSGTTAAPKGVLLRHRNLTSYLFQTVEFASAQEEDAALVSTPPYHIAAMGQVLSNIYSGRRMVYLDDFSPQNWLATVRREGVTTAMVVPTMLARIVEFLGEEPANVPTLRSLAYGGARMPLPVLERALRLFPATGFVNAYGLTETSSTIAVLSPDDHRGALTDPALRPRLASAGRLVPGIEAEVRDEEGNALGEGESGLLWVRGAQVSGEYLEQGASLDDEGWFPTKDEARILDGYLYITGRSDDTIIRGGENIAPAEIEDVLIDHPDVRDVAVIGMPDDEWGQRIVAVIVVAEGSQPDAARFRDYARARLRGSRTPDDVVFVPGLPRTPTGKLVRRRLVSDLSSVQA